MTKSKELRKIAKAIVNFVNRNEVLAEIERIRYERTHSAKKNIEYILIDLPYSGAFKIEVELCSIVDMLGGDDFYAVRLVDDFQCITVGIIRAAEEVKVLKSLIVGLSMIAPNEEELPVI